MTCPSYCWRCDSATGERGFDGALIGRGGGGAEGAEDDLARLVMRGEQRSNPQPKSGIALASLLFGAAHLQQANELAGGTVAVIAFVLLANGGIALIFGWLFWRKGLIAAMTAHTTQDIITKAIIPLMMTS